MGNVLGHIEALKVKHTELHKRIEALEAERAPEKYIKPLKIKKLEIKDNIAKFEAAVYTHGMDIPDDKEYDL